MTILRNNLFVLLTFLVIGFLVHAQSLKMVPYGDDWRFIYNYFTHEEVVANLSPLPGLFAYMAPYGPSMLTIGFLYQIFGNNYSIYYLVPLIFKILTTFVIFLILRDVSTRLNRGNYLISFLAATLFLVGTTGLQAIDWAFHMNVYITLFIFVLSLFFQIRFCHFGGNKNLILALLLSLLAILFAPFRLSPLILAVPLIDLIMFIRNRQVFSAVLLKNIIFFIVIFIFFLVGLFGYSPGTIYSPSSSPLSRFIQEVSTQPLSFAKSFLYWVGISIVPSYPSGSPDSFILGIIFLALLLIVLYKSKNKYIILFSAVFFIPLFSMWMITTYRTTDSADKYLPLPFLGLSFLIGVLVISTGRFKKIFIAVLLGLVLMQAYSTMKIYSYWISIGRGKDFIIPIQETIMSHFSSPLQEPKIIYLDFDNPSVQQSIEFGLGYRVAVLSETKGLENFPLLVSKKENLINLIKEREQNEQIDEIIKDVVTFQYRKGQFADITSFFQETLRNQLK